MKITGITRRWAFNTLLLTCIILIFISAFSVIGVAAYYRTYVENYLSVNANESVLSFFSPYLDSSNDVFEQKAIEYIENFDNKAAIEVQVVTKNEKIVSSSGFPVDFESVRLEDVSSASKSKTGISKWSGFDENREHIMSVAMVFPSQNGEFNGAVRFLTSLHGVDYQIGMFSLVVALICLVAIGLVASSGLFFVQTIVRPLRSINDITKRFTAGDVNVKVELENKQNESDEIAELANSVNDMITQINATDKMKNDFISTVSHELRTPLTAIKGWGEMLKELDGEDKELSKRGTEVIINESERLSSLVEELLDFSRMQSGRLTLRLKKIDVLAELDEAIFVFKERSKREGIELSYSVPDIPAPMMADPDRIKQVFVNILDNAFKYNKQNGLVLVEAFCSDGALKIDFTDNGCGISAEDLPNVTKKFYKANIQVRGSGIGLAVVDEIIKLHNGVFEIKSELGVGTKVTVILPVEKVDVEENISVIEEMAVVENEQRSE